MTTTAETLRMVLESELADAKAACRKATMDGYELLKNGMEMDDEDIKKKSDAVNEWKSLLIQDYADWVDSDKESEELDSDNDSDHPSLDEEESDDEVIYLVTAYDGGDNYERFRFTSITEATEKYHKTNDWYVTLMIDNRKASIIMDKNREEDELKEDVGIFTKEESVDISVVDEKRLSILKKSYEMIARIEGALAESGLRYNKENNTIEKH
jgi:hypothetical protein